MKRLAVSCVLAACIAAGVMAPANAATINVTTCADSGAGSLRQALAAVTAATTIQFAPTCNGDNAIAIATTLDFPAFNVTLDGGSATRTVLRRANGFSGALLNLAADTATQTLRNLTIDGNNLAADMQIQNVGNLVIDKVALVRSKSAYAGIFHAGGTLNVTDSSFTDNVAYSLDTSDTAAAAVLYASSDKAVSIARSTFSRNSGCVIDLAHCYFSAVINSDSNISISASTFDNNSGYFGAVKVGETSTASISNSTFAGNHAQDGGAAIYFTKGSVTTSTFVDNTSTNNAQQLFVNLLDDADTPPSMAASIVRGDGIKDDCSPLTDLGANLATSATCIVAGDLAASSRVVTSAQLDLQPLALNQTSPDNTGLTQTIALGVASIARDFFTATSAGFTGTVPATDQRGASRPGVGTIDVGAYEYGVTPPPACPVVLKKTINFSAGSAVLTATAKKTVTTYAQSLVTAKCSKVTLTGYAKALGLKPAAAKSAQALASRRISAVVSVILSTYRTNHLTAPALVKQPAAATRPAGVSISKAALRLDISGAKA